MGEIDAAFARALLYNALALGFRPPSSETLKRLARTQEAKTVEEAASVLDPVDHSGLVSAAQRLVTTHVDSLKELEGSFQRLFGHTARGVVPPYETEYGTEALFQQPHEMGDLMGFYRAFGLTLNSAEHERADHVSCECEFLSFLALKEVYALEQGDRSMLQETRKATRLFLQDHLGRFAPAFAKKLAREDRSGFYGALADLCDHLISQDCASYGVPAGSRNLTLRPANDDRIPMACGSSAECMGMPGAGDEEESEDP